MTEIFISYAREDRDRADTLANVLTALGWSVWWDQKIICWVGHNPDKLVAVYSYMNHRLYTSFTDEDRTTTSDGDSVRTWKDSEVRRLWEWPCHKA